MTIHKLEIGDFDDIDYCLIAIHTSLEDYRLAYFINKKLSINLGKSKDEVPVHIKDGQTYFSRFYYYDIENTVSWNLVQNKNEVFQQNREPVYDLFSQTPLEIATKVFLLPEFKKVDYFLKIENTEDLINLSEIKQILNTIEDISTAYTVDMNQIKSKNNLIF